MVREADPVTDDPAVEAAALVLYRDYESQYACPLWEHMTEDDRNGFRELAAAVIDAWTSEAEEVFAMRNGGAIVPMSAADVRSIRSPKNRSLMLHAHRTPWKPLDPPLPSLG